MGSALLNPAVQAAVNRHAAGAAPETPDELRRQVAARLAAHRERRLRKDGEPREHNSVAGTPHDPQKSRIAAAVAERYANAQSYRAFLAAEAERAIQQAQAAAEVAARNALAVAEAQQRLLDSLAVQAQAAQVHSALHPAADGFEDFTEHALWPEFDKPAQSASTPHPSPQRSSPNPEASQRARAARPGTSRPPETNASFERAPDPVVAAVPAVRVVLYDETSPGSFGAAPRAKSAIERRAVREQHLHDPEALALDEEISFRQAPVFEESPGPPMPLPANLIEFPRQLVASRKARPRYAEGPLRDDEAAAAGTEQLRIFEVDPAQISITPETSEPAAATSHPQWTSIWLDTPGSAPNHVPSHAADVQEHAAVRPAPARLHAAKLSRRVLAGSIDLAITALAGLACAAACAGTAGIIAGQTPWRLETLRAVAAEMLHTVAPGTLGLSAILALVLLSTLLQAVFFTFSDATPGMRLARIGLCTFSDENPTRAAMRRRIPALVLSTGLLGLGFAWSLLDQDRLTWHDLISRMYQRSY